VLPMLEMQVNTHSNSNSNSVFMMAMTLKWGEKLMICQTVMAILMPGSAGSCYGCREMYAIIRWTQGFLRPITRYVAYVSIFHRNVSTYEDIIELWSGWERDFHPEDLGGTVPQNVAKYLAVYTASHPKW
jgi:hypothetical protein